MPELGSIKVGARLRLNLCAVLCDSHAIGRFSVAFPGPLQPLCEPDINLQIRTIARQAEASSKIELRVGTSLPCDRC